ncbi:hypothetical protein [Kitasatospora sp. NBC_01302]|uniref:hypothetical protein n=1 Tax=Kitasatospora sp. NBC_01302 TaxID=2903575 RepID=UPI002E0DB882|nr:hypothetical protein OG294_27895 [Kitasatospora sp. NBC_01302]
MYFLMPRAPRVSLRATFSRAIARTALRIADAASEFTAPLPAQPVEQPAEDPTDTYTADDMPELAVIEAAAAEYERAAEQARRADRGKRAARKVLDRLPAGSYGRWLVERVSNNRQTADLQEIARIFKANGLGPVPMKQSAPSLKVKQAPAVTAPVEFQVLAGVA